MRRINSSDFRIARRGLLPWPRLRHDREESIDPSRMYVGGEITIAWDLLESMVRDSMRDQALTPKAAETPISVVQLSDHPRLGGAAALILTPAFAAPTIA